MDGESRSLAMLVDGDNISHKTIKAIIDEASRHGNLKIRRVYGDWSNHCLAQWKEAANLNAVLQIQQSNYTSGKNSTDGALIIDAMRMLHEEKVDGFCIVSSDSDYTRLAIELHEHGKFVHGIGSKQTPSSLVSACDLFTYIETITASNEPSGTVSASASASISASASASTKDSDHNTEWVDVVTKAIEELAGDDAVWVLLADVGHRLRAINPAFDPRAYGFKNLHSLVGSKPGKFVLEVHELAGKSSGHKVRLKSEEPGK